MMIIIRILNSITVLWSMHPYFRGITLVMAGSWLIIMLFPGSGNTPAQQSPNNPTITNSAYNSGAPTPPIPPGHTFGSPTISNQPAKTIHVKPGNSIDNANFEKSEEQDDFAIIKESE